MASKKVGFGALLAFLICCSLLILVTFRIDARGMDGPLRVGSPLPFYSSSAGFGGPSSSSWNFAFLLADLVVYGAIGLGIWACYRKLRGGGSGEGDGAVPEAE